MLGMTANTSLVAFLVAFGALLWIAVKLNNVLSGKRFSDGPSLVPVIPLLPLFMLAAGVLVNFLASPWGTIGVTAIHFGWLTVATASIWIAGRNRTKDDK